MPQVRSVLAHHHGLAAHHHPVLGAESAGDDFVLADAVHSQGGSSLGGSRGGGRIRHRGSVEREIVGSHRRAVGAEPGSAGSGSAARRRERLLGYTGLEHRQVHVVPPVERQVGHASLVHDGTERAAGDVDERRFRTDHHFFLGHCSHFQRRTHDQFLRHFQNQATLRLRPEAGKFNPHRVTAHGQCRRPKGAVLACRHCARQACLFIQDDDARTGHYCARGVFHYAENGAGVLLRGSRKSRCQQKSCSEGYQPSKCVRAFPGLAFHDPSNVVAGSSRL